VSEKPYVLQYGSLAGWPWQLANGLRNVGVSSVNVIQENSDVHDLDRQLPHDRALCRKSDSRFAKLKARAAFFREARNDASLVHYHGGVILPGRYHHLIEGPLLSRRGIPMLMSFGGGDARIINRARVLNPYFYREADEARDQATHAYLKSISRHIRHVATDCEMISYVEPYFERCFVFRQPIDISRVPYVAPRVDRPPVLLHIPTEPIVKGTPYIEAAVARLQSEGLSFEFRMKRRLPQAQMMAELADCDIYVDELRCGSYGVTAVEAMTAGKPTLTYIRPDLVERYPADLPLVNANPDTVYEKLRSLIEDAALRQQISLQSRAYAEKYHAMEVVVSEMLDTYRAIGWKG
jgi:hypothetical protein